MSTIHGHLARLSDDAHACRARAVRLATRLRLFDHRAAELAALRERLRASVANLDRAVATLCATITRLP